MDRTGFLRRVVLLGGGALVVPSVLLQSCEKQARVWTSLSDADIHLLDELGETLLPSTEKLPGASAVEIGKYVVQVVNDCLLPEDQDIFLLGLGSIDDQSIENYGKRFEDLGAESKNRLLTAIQHEAIAFQEQQESANEPKVHYFSLLKELVVSGYFTSKTIMTEGFDYSPIPGRYEGCVDFQASTDKIYKG